MADFSVPDTQTLIQQASHGGGYSGNAVSESNKRSATEQGPLPGTIRIASNNWTLTFTSAGWGDTPLGNTLTVKAYYRRNNSGPLLPLMFGGQSTVTLSADLSQCDVTCDAITTDALQVGDLPEVSLFEDTGSNTGKLPLNRLFGGYYSNRGDGIANPDVSSVRQADNGAGNYWNGPGLVSGVPLSGAHKETVFLGDSRTRGEGNNYKGWMGENVPATATFINMGELGAQAFQKIANSTHWLRYIKAGCRVVINLGINDLRQGRTSAQVWADLQTLAQMCIAAGAAEVYICAIAPDTTDTGNTTAGANNPKIVTLNNLIRANNKQVLPANGGADWILSGSNTTANIAGFFELSDAVSTARDSGIWKTGASTDWLHETTQGAQLESAVIPTAFWAKDAVVALSGIAVTHTGPNGQGKYQFSAAPQPSGASLGTVTWSTDAGSITANGLLTPPAPIANAQTVNVTATSGGVSGADSVTVAGNGDPDPDGEITGISISPTTATVQGGATRNFSGTVTGAGNFDDSVTFSLVGAGSGDSITGTSATTATLTAGPATQSPRTFQVRATAADGTTIANASVTIPAASGGGGTTVIERYVYAPLLATNTTTIPLKEGDTGPSRCVQLGVPVAEGATVLYRLARARTGEVVVEAPATVRYDMGGIVQYDWADPIPAAGRYREEWEVTLPGGQVTTFATGGVIQITEALG